jgi:hypothetical protein
LGGHKNRGARVLKDWERYEQAAREILKQLREHFDLADVTGKQSFQGASGTDWEIDVVGIAKTTGKIVDIECRLTKGRQSQAKLAALAFTIKDVGGDRGIIVTPKPLQKGSKLVAQSAGITHFKLDSKSEANNFFAEALGKMFLGIPSLGDTCQFGEPGIGRG